jgi:acyl-CoA synthetase (AMP-forming)/AMP-acid ligase II
MQACNVMAGYIGGLEATAATIDDDGWLHTGDVAVLDQAGNVEVTYRATGIVTRLVLASTGDSTPSRPSSRQRPWLVGPVDPDLDDIAPGSYPELVGRAVSDYPFSVDDNDALSDLVGLVEILVVGSTSVPAATMPRMASHPSHVTRP